MPEYLDKYNNPIDLNEWIKLFNDENYRRICKNESENFYVSTVWLGVHILPDDDCIFETMVFSIDKGNEKPNFGSELHLERTSSIVEAQKAHRRACSLFNIEQEPIESKSRFENIEIE